MCVVCGDDLSEKKKFEKQRLASVSECLFNTLENVMKEIDKRRLVSRDKVICRKCKAAVESYEKARKVLVKRILDSNQRLSTASSPHTPIAAVSRKRSGLTPEGAALVAAPKRLCIKTGITVQY